MAFDHLSAVSNGLLHADGSAVSQIYSLVVSHGLLTESPGGGVAVLIAKGAWQYVGKAFTVLVGGVAATLSRGIGWHGHGHKNH